jgi:hypothetical protein
MAVTLCTTRFNICFFPQIVFMCLYGSQNKQRLFPCTATTDWFLQQTQFVYCAVRNGCLSKTLRFVRAGLMLIQRTLIHSSLVGQMENVCLCAGDEYARELSLWMARGLVLMRKGRTLSFMNIHPLFQQLWKTLLDALSRGFLLNPDEGSLYLSCPSFGASVIAFLHTS